MPTGPIRAGFVAPCLNNGGGENYQLFLVDALGAVPPTRPITWVGCAVLDSASNADPLTKAATEAIMPVTFGEQALRDLAASVELLIAWAVYPYHAAIIPRPKIIYVVHRTETWSFTSGAWLQLLDNYVTVSSSAQSAMPSAGAGYGALTRIENGIRPTRIAITKSRSTKRAEWGLSLSNKIYGSVSRLATEKDPEGCLRLSSLLSSPAACAIVGDGPLASTVAGHITAASPPVPVIMTGSQDDIGNTMNAMDSVLVFDRVDSFGYTIAHAWWLGVPVISTDVGIAHAHPSYVRSIPFNATAAQIKAAVDADAADPTGTASRVAAAMAYAQSQYDLGRFGHDWAAVINSYT